MIRKGSEGSLTLFFKDQLISSYPLSKRNTYERYKYQGEYLILQSMRKKIKIKQQIFTYTFFCNQMIRLKNEGKSIRESDGEMFLTSIFALIKLKILDEDDCIFIQPLKKKRVRTIP